MKKIYLLLILIVFTSCNYILRTTSVEIINNTNHKIESLIIMPNANSKKVIIEKGKSINYSLDLSSIPKRDGSYLLSYKSNNKLIERKFGYYSNGMPMENKIVIRIKNDSIDFKSIY